MKKITAYSLGMFVAYVLSIFLFLCFSLSMAMAQGGPTPVSTRRLNTDSIVERQLEKGIDMIGALRMHDSVFMQTTPLSTSSADYVIMIDTSTGLVRMINRDSISSSVSPGGIDGSIQVKAGASLSGFSDFLFLGDSLYLPGWMFSDTVVWRLDTVKFLHTTGGGIANGFPNGNLFLGYLAGQNYSGVGYANVGIGPACFQSMTTGSGTGGYSNTGLGYGAGNRLTNGAYANTIAGTQAYSFATAREGSSIFGYHGGLNATAGQMSVLGAFAVGGTGPFTGGSLSTVGYRSFFNATSADFCGGLGEDVFSNLTTGDDNLGLGFRSGFNVGGASSRNTFVGGWSGNGTGSAVCNNMTSLGFRTFFSITTADYGIAIGDSTGLLTTTGDYQLLIGHKAEALTPTTNNFMNIGNLMYATDLYLPTVSMGIGTTAPAAKLDLQGDLRVAITAPSASTNDSILVKDASTGIIEAIPAPLSGSSVLDFPSTNAQTSSDLTITVTGALDGDVVALGQPGGSAVANGCFTAWVSATNTVTVRFNNYDSIAADPASGTFTVKVLR